MSRHIAGADKLAGRPSRRDTLRLTEGKKGVDQIDTPGAYQLRRSNAGGDDRGHLRQDAPARHNADHVPRRVARRCPAPDTSHPSWSTSEYAQVRYSGFKRGYRSGPQRTTAGYPPGTAMALVEPSASHGQQTIPASKRWQRSDQRVYHSQQKNQGGGVHVDRLSVAFVCVRREKLRVSSQNPPLRG